MTLPQLQLRLHEPEVSTSRISHYTILQIETIPLSPHKSFTIPSLIVACDNYYPTVSDLQNHLH
jgi:hypothetical protein